MIADIQNKTLQISIIIAVLQYSLGICVLVKLSFFGYWNKNISHWVAFGINLQVILC